MDIHNLEQIKQEFSGFQQVFETGNKEKALEKLLRGRTELSYEEQQKVTAKLYRRGFRLDAVRRQIDLWRERNDCQY